MKKRKLPLRRVRGYSLVELLVVVAMIGMFSLVTVPPMISYMNQIRVRSATRVLNGDLRAARQRAITRNNPVAVSFLPGDADPDVGMEKGQYAIYDRTGTSAPFGWTQVGPTRFLEGVYFLPSGFPVDDALADDMPDIIFRANGTVDNMSGAVPVNPAVIGIRTEKDIMNNRVTNTYTVAGSFTTTLTSD